MAVGRSFRIKMVDEPEKMGDGSDAQGDDAKNCKHDQHPDQSQFQTLCRNDVI